MRVRVRVRARVRARVRVRVRVRVRQPEREGAVRAGADVRRRDGEGAAPRARRDAGGGSVRAIERGERRDERREGIEQLGALAPYHDAHMVLLVDEHAEAAVV